MSQSILVIGGNRYFGVALVEALLAQGHRVTLANRGNRPDPFGARLQRIRVDRSDAQAMQARFGRRTRFDRVYDQVAYGAQDAQIAAEVFRGRVGRYLMTSTLEVYDTLHGSLERPYCEADLVLRPAAETDYGGGKRQAERILGQAPDLPLLSLRLGHVLGGPEDFTGRLQACVARVQQGQVLRHAQASGRSSFIDVPGLVACMLWAGEQQFLGALNVACEDGWSALDLHRRIALRLGRQVLSLAQELPGEGPFDYAAPHELDLGHLRRLGWKPGRLDDVIDSLVDRHAGA